MPKKKQQKTKYGTGSKSIKQTYKITLEYSFFITCTEVLTDETGASGVKGIHDIKNQCVCICSGRTSGDHNGIKRVDADLYKQIGNRKNRILDPRRNSDHQN